MSTLDRFSLKGKTTIITGASQGIGESIAMGMVRIAGEQAATCVEMER